MGRGEERIVGLDSLRGLAALSVAVFHYSFYFDMKLPGHPPGPFQFTLGYYGVNLFFMISGFVIMMTLVNTRKPMDFLVSRFSRLFPAYWAAMILTTLAMRLAGLETLAIGPVETVFNATMLQGFAGIPSVDDSYWTLQIELGFYALMFLLHWARQLERVNIFLAAMLGLFLAEQVFPGRLPAIIPAYGILREILILTHFPLFAMGIALYRLSVRPGAGWRRAGDLAVLLAGLALIKMQVPWDSFALHLLFAGALFLAGRKPSTFLSWRPLVALGTLSYSFYLIHQFVGYAVIHAGYALGVGRTLSIPAALAACLALAAALHHGVEKPALRAIRSRWAGRRHQADWSPGAAVGRKKGITA